MSGPLEGITILDFTRYQQGPSATLMLAELGARVLKVESPDGDPGRMLSRFEDGFPSYFEVLNRGKQSIVVDLRQPDGTAVIAAAHVAADPATDLLGKHLGVRIQDPRGRHHLQGKLTAKQGDVHFLPFSRALPV